MSRNPIYDDPIPALNVIDSAGNIRDKDKTYFIERIIAIVRDNGYTDETFIKLYIFLNRTTPKVLFDFLTSLVNNYHYPRVDNKDLIMEFLTQNGILGSSTEDAAALPRSHRRIGGSSEDAGPGPGYSSRGESESKDDEPMDVTSSSESHFRELQRRAFLASSSSSGEDEKSSLLPTVYAFDKLVKNDDSVPAVSMKDYKNFINFLNSITDKQKELALEWYKTKVSSLRQNSYVLLSFSEDFILLDEIIHKLINGILTADEIISGHKEYNYMTLALVNIFKNSGKELSQSSDSILKYFMNEKNKIGPYQNELKDTQKKIPAMTYIEKARRILKKSSYVYPSGHFTYDLRGYEQIDFLQCFTITFDIFFHDFELIFISGESDKINKTLDKIQVFLKSMETNWNKKILNEVMTVFKMTVGKLRDTSSILTALQGFQEYVKQELMNNGYVYDEEQKLSPPTTVQVARFIETGEGSSYTTPDHFVTSVYMNSQVHDDSSLSRETDEGKRVKTLLYLCRDTNHSVNANFINNFSVFLTTGVLTDAGNETFQTKPIHTIRIGQGFEGRRDVFDPYPESVTLQTSLFSATWRMTATGIDTYMDEDFPDIPSRGTRSVKLRKRTDLQKQFIEGTDIGTKN
jgi:hypothetical protein